MTTRTVGPNEFMAREDMTTGNKHVDHLVDWYVNRTIRSPWRVCTGCLFCVVVTIFIPFIMGLNMAAMDNNDWLITDEPAVEHMDMLNSAYDQLDAGGNTAARTQVAVSQFFMYRSRSGKDVFTAVNLQSMCELEASMVNHKKFDRFCLLDASSAGQNCSQHADVSIVQFFYNQLSSGPLFLPNGVMSCSLLNETAVSSLAATLVQAADNAAGQLQYGFFLSKSTTKKGFSDKTRSVLSIGGPLDGYGKLLSLGDKQTEKYQHWLFDWVRGVWKEYGMKGRFLRSAFMDRIEVGDLDMLIYSLIMWDFEGYRLFESDFFMVIFAFLFVFAWILNHTRSLFLAIVGMLQIFLSLPASLFFYRVIFQITYFSTLQQLVIFVVLGVGADDIFVLRDSWAQSAVQVPRSASVDGTDQGWAVTRLKYAYIRTTQAVLNTSVTTAMAFFATAVSPIMPIATFGVFGGTCIVMNYVLVITLTPAVIIISEYRLPSFSWKPTCRGGSGEPTTSDSKSTSGLDADKGSPDASGPQASCWERAPLNILTKGLDQLFLEKYKQVLSNRQASLVLVICFLIYACLSAVWASQLQAPTGQEQWLHDDHMFTRAESLSGRYLSKDEDNYGQLDIVWGMRGLDRKKFDRYYPNERRGNVNFDPDFDLFAVGTQNVIYEACDSLPNWQCNAGGCEYGLLVRPNSTICFLRDFDTWAQRTKGVHPSTMVGDEANRTTYFDWLKEFRQTQNPLGDQTKSYSELIGFVDGQVKFVGIRSRLTMQKVSPVKIKDPIEERCKKFIKSLSRPETARSVFQYSWDWTWSPTQTGTIVGMIDGMSIAFPIAFATLLLATYNYVISLFAIFSVGSIVAATLGMTQAYLGWSLGTGEAIAGVMVIGLAVDYTIHLGHMYDHATKVGVHNRLDKVMYAADKMCLTVVAGAITTAGAGLFMFACQSTFFGKMATLISGTVFWSLAYSLLFFMPLLSLCGPEEGFGRIDVFFQRIRSSSDPEETMQQPPKGSDLMSASAATDSV